MCVSERERERERASRTRAASARARWILPFEPSLDALSLRSDVISPKKILTPWQGKPEEALITCSRASNLLSDWGQVPTLSPEP